MTTISHFLHFILHLDLYLAYIANNYGAWIYGFLLIIIFSESAFVFIPFLPGDSLLIAAGALAAVSIHLDVNLLAILLILAATIGNIVNYGIGKKFGAVFFNRENSLFFKKSYIEKTHGYFERYGSKTIFIARFLPIIRTFAPFVAGLGEMTFFKFVIYSFISAALWVVVLLYMSYLYGNIPIIKNNFSLVILVVIVVSMLPAIIGFIKLRFNKSSA